MGKEMDLMLTCEGCEKNLCGINECLTNFYPRDSKTT